MRVGLLVVLLYVLLPAASAQETRALRPGDTVRITVHGAPELSGVYTVGQDGQLELPVLGKIATEGLTEADLFQDIQKRLEEAYPQARVSPGVPLNGMATALLPLAPGDIIEISVADEPEWGGTLWVRNDGKIAMPPDIEIQAAGLTVSQFVGQLTERLREYIVGPVVTVRGIQRWPRRAYIMGAVRSPGAYSVWEYPTLLSVLSAAGGVLPTADTAKATIVRADESQPLPLDTILERGEPTADVPLQDGDKIIIPSLRAEEVFVAGEVLRPGSMLLRPGDKVSSALARASGLAQEADASAALLIRGGQATPVDLDAVLAGRSPEQDLPLEPNDMIVVPERVERVYVTGQVARPGFYDLEDTNSLIGLVGLAGGLLERANSYRAVLVRGDTATVVDLHALLATGDPGLDVPLEAGDRLVVPELEDRVYVFGDVRAPGAVPLHPDDTYMDVIAAAGGFGPDAGIKRILLVGRGTQPGEEIRTKLIDLARGDPEGQEWRPRPGDMVYVPTSREARRREWVRQITGMLGGIWTALLVRQ